MEYRTFTMSLRPTRRQSVVLTDLLGHLTDLYNAALQERRDAWQMRGDRVTKFGQYRELTALRAEYPDYARYPAALQRDPICRVDRAFAGFFRRCKTGQTPGYPRFRAKSRYDSVTVDAQNFTVQDGRLTIRKLGSIRYRTRFTLRGEPKQVVVQRVGIKWIATVVYAIGEAPPKRAVSVMVGIDVGLTDLATCSDGTVVPNPRWTREAEERLARANQALARKVRGSRGRAKARERLRRVHAGIRGRRRAYLHGVSRQLVDRYDLIAHEDLSIANMARGTLSKSILDAAWGELIHQITYKAADAGTWVVPVNPRGTTQECSGCGSVVPKGLAERTHACPVCGLVLGRDLNAARNIETRGRRVVALEAAGGSN